MTIRRSSSFSSVWCNMILFIVPSQDVRISPKPALGFGLTLQNNMNVIRPLIWKAEEGIWSKPTPAVQRTSGGEERKRHRLERVTDAELKIGNPTNHGSLRDDCENEAQPLQIQAPPAMQSKPVACQEQFALMAPQGRKTLVQLCDQITENLKNNKLVLFQFIQEFNSYNMILKLRKAIGISLKWSWIR